MHRRKVETLYGLKYIKGAIEAKKEKVTLIEPDRTNYSIDSKSIISKVYKIKSIK